MGASAVWVSGGVLVVTNGLLYCRAARSVGERVHHVVDAELVCLVGQFDRKEALIRPLPVVSDVVVVVGDEQQSLRRIVVLEHSPELRLHSTIRVAKVQRLDMEEGVEQWMRRVELNEPKLREHAANLLLEVDPVPATNEVVEDDEAPLQHVRTKVRYLFVGRPPEAGFAEIEHRMPEDLGIVQRQHVAALKVHVEKADLLEDAREVPLRAWIVVIPLEVSPSTAETSATS